jgi:hypothetical protein
MQGHDVRKFVGLFLMFAGSLCGLIAALALIAYGLQPSKAGPPWGRILPLMAVAVVGIQLGKWLVRLKHPPADDDSQ